jgi:hypothetical protein
MRLLLTLIVVLWTAAAQAQLVETPLQPYEAAVPVADQSAAARDPALREALRQVVARISGEAAAWSAEPLIDEAPRLVQHYGYRRDADNMLQLVAGFDGRAVEQRLKAQGLPVWGVYAAEAEDVLMQITGLDGSGAYVQVLALLRGLPGVQDVRPQHASGDTLELRVRAEGGAGRLGGALMSAYMLTPDSQGRAQLSYRYLPSGNPAYRPASD